MELKDIFSLNLEIQSKLELVKELRSLIGSIQAIKFTEKVQGEVLDENLTKKLNKIIELENDISKLYDLKIEYSNRIDKLKNHKERAIIRYRYLLGYTWKKISEKNDSK